MNDIRKALEDARECIEAHQAYDAIAKIDKALALISQGEDTTGDQALREALAMSIPNEHKCIFCGASSKLYQVDEYYQCPCGGDFHITLTEEEIESRLTPSATGQDEARPESWEIADEIYNLVDDIRETETDPRYPNAPECERPVLSSRQSMERIEAYCRKREAALRSRQPSTTADDLRNALLLEANDVLRSAYSIAERNGERVSSWGGFRNRVKQALENQHPIIRKLLEEERCPGCPAPKDLDCEGCVPIDDPTARPSSPQGEDDEGAIDPIPDEATRPCGKFEKCRCAPGGCEGCEEIYNWSMAPWRAEIASLRARLASADASARELREALERIEKHFGSPGIVRTWARAALEQAEGKTK